MIITLKPCPFCGKGEAVFGEGGLSHSVPHQKKCSLFHEANSDKIAKRIETFIADNKTKRLELPVVVTTQTWIGGEEPKLKAKFGHTLKLLDHILS